MAFMEILENSSVHPVIILCCIAGCVAFIINFIFAFIRLSVIGYLLQVFLFGAVTFVSETDVFVKAAVITISFVNILPVYIIGAILGTNLARHLID